MKRKIDLGIRFLFGLIFLAAGLAGLFNLTPTPDDLPMKMHAFNLGLKATGYFMTLLKLTEAVTGFLILAGMFVPLALVILAPITLNILFVHVYLMPSGIPLAVVLLVIHLYLSFFVEPYSQKIKGLFQIK